MANTIKIKRRPASGSAGKPSSLYNGELAFNENDNILYYGFGSGVGGIANTVEQIGGSGYFAQRGGVNASGLWPISVTGNAGTVTGGVYTSGNQSIGGQKTFTGSGLFESVFKAAYVGENYNVIFSPTQIYIGQGDIDVKLAGNSYYDPNGIYGPTKEIVNKEYVTNTLSGIVLTAGSGLTGGGNLSTSSSFHIGQGDGISVNADSVAVDSTVVRTTGNQAINGAKSFYDSSNTSLIFSTADDIIRLKAPNTGVTTYYFLGLDGGGSPPSSTSADRSVVSRSAEQLKTDIGLSNVTNDAQVKKIASSTSGNIPFWNGTTGDLLANGYGVETVLTGSSANLPRADAVKTYVDSLIGSGIATNDAMIFKGVIDCSTNPLYPSGDAGWTYKVSVAGKIGGASGPAVEVNDTLICTLDGSPSGDHATVGSNWVILQSNIVDASILVSGPVSATSGNIAMFDGATGKIIKDGGFLASNIVLTTGNQTISGSKTFSSQILANTGISIGDVSNYLTGTGLVINWGDGGGILTSFVNAASSANNSINLNANTTFNNVARNGALPFIISPTGYAGSGAVTQGFWRGSTVEVDKGGTGQTSYTNGQLLIGNSTGNTLTKATLTQGSGVAITNGNGSITISHEDTSILNGPQGGSGIASIGLDGYGHVTGVTTATYLTAGTVCAAIVDCTLDGGSF